VGLLAGPVYVAYPITRFHGQGYELICSQIFPIDTAKSIYQRNCLVGGKDKQTRPKIQFLNPRMYRGMSLGPYLVLTGLTDRYCRPRCLDGSLMRC
jgi:hypothetical protein